MSDIIKISELPELTTPVNTDVLPIVNSNQTKKITVNNLLGGVDLSTKADKVVGATNGHIATLNAQGNLVDGGLAPSEISIPVGGTAPTDNNLWVDTTEPMIVDAGYVFGNTWDITLLSSGWTASGSNYVQTVNALALDSHFVLLGWVDEDASDAQREAYSNIIDITSTADGTVTVTSSAQLSVDLPMHVKYHESTEQKVFDDFAQKSQFTFASNGKVDATGVYDSTLGQTQSSLNASFTNFTNPNLLDNPWFTVNQRGATSGSSYGYMFDRWIFDYGTSSRWEYVPQAGNTLPYIMISIDGRLLQYLEESFLRNINGKQLTLSVLDNLGRIHTGTAVYTYGLNTVFVSDAYVMGHIADNLRLYLRNTSDANIGICAVKLEFGSTSTLAHDIAPNYATELLKC